jgi:carboxymethylenebutenolidase
MLATWAEHIHAEFGMRNPEAALATMVDEPLVFCVPSARGGIGQRGVWTFYREQFLTRLPADWELISLSKVVGRARLVEEFVVRFTHTEEMPWLLPGLAPTHRRTEFVLMVLAGFEAAKVAYEQLLWDHSSLLYQLGVVDHSAAGHGVRSAGYLLKMRPEMASFAANDALAD